MPWEETSVMDQRTRFVLRAMSGRETFGGLCREFGITRKTGYKWKERFVEEGLSGLGDHSRRPKGSPEEIGESVVCEVVKLKVRYPSWGARKLRTVLMRTMGEEVPSESSFKRILDKAGLVRHRRRERKEQGKRLQTMVRAERPNQVWTIDFKGWWYTRDRARFEPLTVRDEYSRYLLCAQAMEDARTETVREQMVRVFERYGLPEVLRSDNGSPFAARRSPLGLSRLSAWWLSMGIDLDRIDPGRPDQNGGHERMHKDLAWEVEGNKQPDACQQQAVLDTWRQTFNDERPHEALGMKVPREFYRSSSRIYDPSPVELVYPETCWIRKVSSQGAVKVKNVQIPLSLALRGYEVGLEPLDADRLAVWFCQLRLGEIDLKLAKFEAVSENN